MASASASPRLTLQQADTIIDHTLAKATMLTTQPMTVAVLDEGGALKAFKKQDGSSLLREEIARGKAWGALGFGVDSRALAGMASDRPHFIQAAVAASGGRLVPVPGGVLIRDQTGTILGAVGASGSSSEIDEACVIAGVLGAGFSLAAK